MIVIGKRRRDIRVGSVLDLQLDDGRLVRLEIAEMKDGRVLFKRPASKKGPRWWIPYPDVLRMGIRVYVQNAPGKAADLRSS